jgi:hypothetical protein
MYNINKKRQYFVDTRYNFLLDNLLSNKKFYCFSTKYCILCLEKYLFSEAFDNDTVKKKFKTSSALRKVARNPSHIYLCRIERGR